MVDLTEMNFNTVDLCAKKRKLKLKGLVTLIPRMVPIYHTRQSYNSEDHNVDVIGKTNFSQLL